MFNYLMHVMALADPRVYAYPYIFAIAVLVIVFSGLTLKFASLRNYRKKSNLRVYSSILLSIGVLATQAYDVSLGPKLISFSIEPSTNEFHPDIENQFNLIVSSDVKISKFYIVINSLNASFLTNNSNYLLVTNNTLKVPFTLYEQKESSQTKPIKFIIDENVTGFRFNLDVEPKLDRNVLATTFNDMMNCRWNASLNCYTIEPIPTICI